MNPSKVAQDLAGWADTPAVARSRATLIDAALDDRYRRGYEAGRREAFAQVRRVLDENAYSTENTA